MKQKSILRMFGIITVLTCCLFSFACASSNVLLNGQSISKKNFASPETHTLIFYYVEVNDFKARYDNFPGFFTETEVFAQMNPEKEPFFVIPLSFSASRAFVIQPIEPGSKMRLLCSSYTVETALNVMTTYYHNTHFGLPDSQTFVFTAKKPGLQYAGAYRRYEFEYEPIKNDYELLTLEGMADYFKDTEWEPLITARIEELKK
ncbi:MAG: hypothetical protein P1P63_04130 [Treponemataceae bacterium]